MIYSNAERKSYTHQIPLPTDLYFPPFSLFFFLLLAFCFDRPSPFVCDGSLRMYVAYLSTTSHRSFSTQTRPALNWWFALAATFSLVCNSVRGVVALLGRRLRQSRRRYSLVFLTCFSWYRCLCSGFHRHTVTTSLKWSFAGHCANCTSLLLLLLFIYTEFSNGLYIVWERMRNKSCVSITIYYYHTCMLSLMLLLEHTNNEKNAK